VLSTCRCQSRKLLSIAGTLVDVWYVMCDVWRVMCDVWCVMCDVWCVMCGVWCMMYDVWCMVYNVWCVHIYTCAGVVVLTGFCVPRTNPTIPSSSLYSALPHVNKCSCNRKKRARLAPTSWQHSLWNTEHTRWNVGCKETKRTILVMSWYVLFLHSNLSNCEYGTAFAVLPDEVPLEPLSFLLVLLGDLEGVCVRLWYEDQGKTTRTYERTYMHTFGVWWRMMCDVWCVMCDMWCVMYDVWCMVYGV